MSFAADDHEAIRRRLEELAAEKALALTGSTVSTEAGRPGVVWSDYQQQYLPADYDPA